ncbi:Targeting protein for XKLP2, putative isoform 4 [Hibiscus syriacus]|uniref:Targeting protein for XKLP2, putative isoform 4 n=1 Tax=Hibiscus syriacus TaxID=106335 RepID=A0A6A3ASY5_HIBSY|nr:Targeting protein for XKLP2, putative isoform 4 [Hibiscus syriacus]
MPRDLVEFFKAAATTVRWSRFKSDQASESSSATASNSNSEDEPQAKLVPDKVMEEIKPSEAKISNDDNDKENIGTMCSRKWKKKLVSNKKHLSAKSIASSIRNSSVLKPKTGNAGTPNLALENQSTVQVETEDCTPQPLMNSQKKLLSDKKHQTAKKIASSIRSSSVLKPKTDNVGTPHLALESQAIKRQKLDGGRSRQILTVKPHNLPHKSKLGLASGSSNLNSSNGKTF